MSRIFISFSHDDKSFADQLGDLLRTTYDYESIWYDDQLETGSEWWKNILKNIEECHVFIYLLSPESLESKFCRQEYGYAKGLHKPIIPVIVKPGTEVTIKALAKIQHLDMSAGITLQNLAKLSGDINRLLKIGSPPSSTESSSSGSSSSNRPFGSILSSPSKPTPSSSGTPTRLGDLFSKPTPSSSGSSSSNRPFGSILSSSSKPTPSSSGTLGRLGGLGSKPTPSSSGSRFGGSPPSSAGSGSSGSSSSNRPFGSTLSAPSKPASSSSGTPTRLGGLGSKPTPSSSGSRFGASPPASTPVRGRLGGLSSGLSSSSKQPTPSSTQISPFTGKPYASSTNSPFGRAPAKTQAQPKFTDRKIASVFIISLVIVILVFIASRFFNTETSGLTEFSDSFDDSYSSQWEVAYGNWNTLNGLLVSDTNCGLITIGNDKWNSFSVEFDFGATSDANFTLLLAYPSTKLISYATLTPDSRVTPSDVIVSAPLSMEEVVKTLSGFHFSMARAGDEWNLGMFWQEDGYVMPSSLSSNPTFSSANSYKFRLDVNTRSASVDIFNFESKFGFRKSLAGKLGLFSCGISFDNFVVRPLPDG